MQRPLLLSFALLSVLSACTTTSSQRAVASRVSMADSIKSEAPGDYYIGRRLYKQDYKFWGFVRRPGQSWAEAKLVMLNEQEKLAPDRENNQIGSDNDYEYKLLGSFSGQTVYEPASNGFYPEFVLKGAELRSISPARIYKSPGATDPTRRVIPTAY